MCNGPWRGAGVCKSKSPAGCWGQALVLGGDGAGGMCVCAFKSAGRVRASAQRGCVCVGGCAYMFKSLSGVWAGARQRMRVQESVRGVCVRQPVWGVGGCASAHPRGMPMSVKGSACANARGGTCKSLPKRCACKNLVGWARGQRGGWVCVKVPVRGMRVQEPVGWAYVHRPLREGGAIARRGGGAVCVQKPAEAGYACSPSSGEGVCKGSGMCKSLRVPVGVQPCRAGLGLELCLKGWVTPRGGGHFHWGSPEWAACVGLCAPWHPQAVVWLPLLWLVMGYPHSWRGCLRVRATTSPYSCWAPLCPWEVLLGVLEP